MFRAFWANFWKNLIEFKRYYFDSISGILTILVFFYLIFFGVKTVGGGTPGFGKTLDGIIVGYFMWLMFVFSFQGVSWGIIEEAQRGTLEQVFMSPIPFEFQLFSRIIGNFVLNVSMVVVLMYFAAFTTGRTLNFDFLTLIYLLIVGVMCATGIGMIIGGIALIFKRVSSFVQIVTIGSLAFTMIDPKTPIMKFIPMSQVSYLMRQMAINKIGIMEFPFIEHLYLWLVSLLYLSLGIFIFRLFEKKAMRTGALSQY